MPAATGARGRRGGEDGCRIRPSPRRWIPTVSCKRVADGSLTTPVHGHDGSGRLDRAAVVHRARDPCAGGEARGDRDCGLADLRVATELALVGHHAGRPTGAGHHVGEVFERSEMAVGPALDGAGSDLVRARVQPGAGRPVRSTTAPADAAADGERRADGAPGAPRRTQPSPHRPGRSRPRGCARRRRRPRQRRRKAARRSPHSSRSTPGSTPVSPRPPLPGSNPQGVFAETSPRAGSAPNLHGSDLDSPQVHPKIDHGGHRATCPFVRTLDPFSATRRVVAASCARADRRSDRAQTRREATLSLPGEPAALARP